MGGAKLTSYAELADVLANLPLLLHEKRRSEGLSMRATAAALGMSLATVARMESGADCVMSNATKVLHWLNGGVPPCR